MEMMDIRIFYRRFGPVKYISHLDTNRLMQRALSRSGLPVWFTQGFNPHLYLTFAAPLSLGVESECESMDIRLTEPVPPEEIVSRLNAQMPEGYQIKSAGPPEMSPNQICNAEYEIALEVPDPEAALQQWEQFYRQPQIPVEKKTKNGWKTMDIRPLIKPLQAQSDPGKGVLTVRLLCAAGNQANVNPALVTGAFCGQFGYDPLDVSYHKLRVLSENGGEFH